MFAWLWVRLGTREPSSPAKFALGLLFVGAGFAVLVVAAQLAENGVQGQPDVAGRRPTCSTPSASCRSSPVGLSAMTKLAPARIAGLMMGVWFLGTRSATSSAAALASLLRVDAAAAVCSALIAAFGIGAGLVMFALTPSDQAADGRRQLESHDGLA